MNLNFDSERRERVGRVANEDSRSRYDAGGQGARRLYNSAFHERSMSQGVPTTSRQAPRSRTPRAELPEGCERERPPLRDRSQFWRVVWLIYRALMGISGAGWVCIGLFFGFRAALHTITHGGDHVHWDWFAYAFVFDIGGVWIASEAFKDGSCACEPCRERVAAAGRAQ